MQLAALKDLKFETSRSAFHLLKVLTYHLRRYIILIYYICVCS